MNYDNLEQRTKRFALDVIILTGNLPKDQACQMGDYSALRTPHSALG